MTLLSQLAALAALAAPARSPRVAATAYPQYSVAVLLVRGAEPGLGEDCLDEAGRYWMAGSWLIPRPRR
jgi:hypothetical protein